MVGELVPIRVDPVTADRDFWKRYHELRRARHSELYPDDPIDPDEVEEAGMKKPNPFDRQEYFEMSRDGVAAGARPPHGRARQHRGWHEHDPGVRSRLSAVVGRWAEAHRHREPAQAGGGRLGDDAELGGRGGQAFAPDPARDLRRPASGR